MSFYKYNGREMRKINKYRYFISKTLSDFRRISRAALHLIYIPKFPNGFDRCANLTFLIDELDTILPFTSTFPIEYF